MPPRGRGEESAPEGEESAPESIDEAGSRAEASVRAFREALEKSITISRDRLEEVVEDSVRRGRMTRADGEELIGRLVSRGRQQVEDLLSRLGELEGSVGRARGDIGARATKVRRRARNAADQPLRQVDRARRRAGIGFPITAYDQLSVPQINDRLRELTQQELRRVRDYERRKRGRKGVLQAVERKLEQP